VLKEFWSARDLQELMGYTEWRKFADAIERAMITYRNSGHDAESHLAAKLVQIGSGARRSIRDYHLTRYAAYLIAMNSDHSSTKDADEPTLGSIIPQPAATFLDKIQVFRRASSPLFKNTNPGLSRTILMAC
jgi:DNA-damage-inducible protein D